MNTVQFRDRVRALKEPVTDKKPPYWEYWRHKLWKHFTGGNNPFNFMSWPCIYHTMLVNHWTEPVAYEFTQIGWERWHNAIISPAFAPMDYHADTIFSRNLIHQAYHIHVWEQKTGKRIEEMDSIIEVGGGYGAMALLCHRMGFIGTYHIYDLPEFSLLQEFFLSEMEVPNIIWPTTKHRRSADLLIGLYSLSEIEMDKRNKFLDSITADSYLLLYSGHWKDYDNIAYFEGRNGLAENWETWEIQHLPDPDNWYTVGW